MKNRFTTENTEHTENEYWSATQERVHKEHRAKLQRQLQEERKAISNESRYKESGRKERAINNEEQEQEI